MKKHSIATIVNFCTNESRFLKFCLEEARRYSRQVIVVVCDHFFDGTFEDHAQLQAIYRAFPECLFVEYPFIPHKISKNLLKRVDPAHFWHSLSRLLGVQFLKDDIESVLFLDTDEVPEGDRFAEWLDVSNYHCHTVLKLANYWYFREACYQADVWEDSVVLAQRRALEPHLLLRKEERDAIYDLMPGPKRRRVVGVDGSPMFHHYSWVRTQEEMLRKVRAWGHKGDRDWTALVQKEFSEPFGGVDFVHCYSCKTVTPPFPISLSPPQFQEKGSPRLIRMKESEVLKNIDKAGGSFWNLLFR